MTADIIHLESESIDLTRQKIRLTAEALYDRSEQIYARFANVDWESTAKYDYLYELYQCLSKIKSLSDQLDHLGFRLSQESDQWMNIGSRFTP